MRKIALQTWHHTENYGTAYQAYALKTLIEQQGFHVDLVDYHRLGSSPADRGNIIKIFFLLLKTIKNILQSKKAFKFNPSTFNDFYSQYFTYTKKCTYNQDFEELNNIYEGFVCGSDQIWGPEWFDARYFLDYVHDNKRIIAYAPSIGVASVKNLAAADLMRPLIIRFPYLSVREATGCDIARELTGRDDVVNVLDPVLMLNSSEWAKIEKVCNLPSKPYCLIFFLMNNDRYFRCALDYCHKMNYETVILHCTQSADSQYANVNELTPGQLLYVLRNATFVCTDSFHITVLSIIQNKQFCVFKKNDIDTGVSKNNRVNDLLNRVGIYDALFEDNQVKDPQIDYESVNKKVNELRLVSMDYLKKALTSLPDGIGSSEMPDCWKKNICKGCLHKEMSDRDIHNKGIDKAIYKVMTRYPFTLEEKCFRCSKYCGSSFKDKREPLFYYKLKSELKVYNKSLRKIFFKYYFYYVIRNIVRR